MKCHHEPCRCADAGVEIDAHLYCSEECAAEAAAESAVGPNDECHCGHAACIGISTARA